MEILCKRLCLRELGMKDFAFLLDLERHEKVITYEADEIPSAEYIDKKYRDMLKWADEMPRENYCFIVTLPENNQAIGKVTLTMQNDTINEWEIGWTLHPDSWGKGYASEAARAVIEFAFNKLQVHRVVAFCNAENAASEKVMQRAGMRKEGCLRETRFLNAMWKDELVYAVLQRDLINSSSSK